MTPAVRSSASTPSSPGHSGQQRARPERGEAVGGFHRELGPRSSATVQLGRISRCGESDPLSTGNPADNHPWPPLPGQLTGSLWAQSPFGCCRRSGLVDDLPLSRPCGVTPLKRTSIIGVRVPKPGPGGAGRNEAGRCLSHTGDINSTFDKRRTSTCSPPETRDSAVHQRGGASLAVVFSLSSTCV